ncbi:MAG: ribonuclease R family protein, partial [Planctomycetota bacterium]
KRRTTRFVGSYFERAGVGWVQVDGTSFTRPVAVGDPGAKGVHVDDKVVVELVRFPTHLRDGEGVVVEVLGKAGDVGVDTQTVIHEYGLPGPFPEAALDDARRQAAKFDETVPAGRRDLSGRTIITIDPVDARDFDDAISLEQVERGHLLLGVHIADVSHFVREGSPLDQEARARGTSVYLPDRVIPMIPEIVSNNLASLQPDKVRYAKTCWIEFTPEGVPVHSAVEPSAIKSCRRFTYEEVDVFLADPQTRKVELTPEVRALLGRMRDLARLLRRRRMVRGSLLLEMPVVKIDLDRDGRVTGAHVTENTESHQIIEEFMLAANQAVARWLDTLQLPFLRRAHAPPDRLKIRRLTEFMKALGIQAEDMQDRFEIQRVVDSVKGQTTEYAVNFAILKSMSKAVYQCEFERHYALNMSHYCHFTSPIRRYPDLVVHRIVEKLIEGQPAKENPEVLEKLGQHCSHTEQTAENAERELVRVKLLHYLDRRVGELLTGIVAGVRSAGLTVRGVEIPVDGLIPVERLPQDRYHFDRETHTLEGYRSGNRFRLGDELIVRIEKVDLARRQLFFRLEKVVHHSTPALRTARRRPKSDATKPRAPKASSRGKKSSRKKRRGP